MVQSPSRTWYVGEPLDAPEVLGAETRPVHHAGADGLESGDLDGYHPAAAPSDHVVRVPEQRAHQPRRPEPALPRP